MEFLPTPFRHTLQGNFPVLFCGLRLCFEIITSVFPLLPCRPFSFHLSNRISSSSILSAISTRSSAYSNSQGSPVLNSLESASSTMIKQWTQYGALVNTKLHRKRITYGTVDINSALCIFVHCLYYPDDPLFQANLSQCPCYYLSWNSIECLLYINKGEEQVLCLCKEFSYIKNFKVSFFNVMIFSLSIMKETFK